MLPTLLAQSSFDATLLTSAVLWLSYPTCKLAQRLINISHNMSAACRLLDTVAKVKDGEGDAIVKLSEVILLDHARTQVSV